MTTPYTASSNLDSLKVKSWTSTSSSLSDAQILSLLNDSLRSYIVPFCKTVRDEWFVSGGELVTVPDGGSIRIPNSVASTIRTISWFHNGQLTPLPRIEPENQWPWLSANGGGSTPVGYVLGGYNIQILPNNVGSIQVALQFMERPNTMVLEEEAARVLIDGSGSTVTLASIPLDWQSSTPTRVDIVDGDSPFSTLFSDIAVSGLDAVAKTITLSGIDASLVKDGMWISDFGTNPFPNIPIEFHPLLQQDVICTMFQGLGDKRLQGATMKQQKLEKDIKSTMSPRVIGSPRPIVNKSAPGMARRRLR